MQIEIENINVAFDTKLIYKDFSLNINEGEFVCVLGKSGTGKTVLLNSILGNIKPLSGFIKVDGKIVERPTKKIGVAYQDFSILPWMTLRQNIRLGSAKEENIERFAEVMKISQYLDMLPKEVSIGTKQRASIARALASDANLILMDEPLCSVDAITSRQIREDIKGICQGRTVVYITHDIREVFELSSRVICLGYEGKIVLDCPTDQTSYEQILTKLNE